MPRRRKEDYFDTLADCPWWVTIVFAVLAYAGLKVARQLGRKGGRKPKMTDSKTESAKKLLASGVPPKDVAKNLGVSIPTPYRWVPASMQA